MQEEPDRLKRFQKAIGKTSSGNEYTIEKIGAFGLKVRCKTVPTKQDVNEVKEVVEAFFGVEATVKGYGKMNKENREKELNDYNEFMRKLREENP